MPAWSLVFAAPHFYWALGGRAGLGAEAETADAALQQSWFAAYNLAAGGLAVLGAALALVLARGWVGQRVKRLLLVLAATAGVILLLRGALGLTLLGVSLLDRSYEDTPMILLAIEPWFVLGGLVYVAMVLDQRAALPASGPHQ